ncbi:AAA family ATPase [Nesterenkonia xinjiangensis]|uniref:Nuclease SbcCD subunit C n=3 Tax=Nesterenkonia xinjiangensis TaxID=225327 RepID=A0A7Z0GII0_9MICC|nr:SMC family ATPase [Nesterenkonia xinjiangensis]NYJ76634.1 exonuclease SbcC [Nesterenkonia xinjiangensis]
MRLHRLRLTAFGPFPGTEEIDFDALSADGLFLLHGRTGSGKTTVLDAVTFALYGDVPGQRDVAGLHSHLAPPEREPSVELEFTQSDRRWLIRRTPPHRRPSRRAKTGFVAQNQTVLLQVHDGEQWREVTSGVQAASKEIQDILPLDRHQFTKVILLPQGEFAQFLHANSMEKQKLLQKLFDTTLFQSLEAELNDRAKQLRERIARAEHRVEVTADGVRSQAQAMLKPALGEDLSRFTAVPPGELGEALELLADWLARDLARSVETAAAEEGAARDRAEVLRRRRTLLQGLAAHEERRAAHEARREAVQQHRTELTRHQQATEIRHWFVNAERLEHEAGTRRDHAAEQIVALRATLGAQQDVDTDGTAAAALVSADGTPDPQPLRVLLDELAQLRGALQEQDAARLERRRREVDDELTLARRRVGEQQEICRRLDEEITGIAEGEQKLAAAWQDVEELEHRSRVLEGFLRLHRRRAELAGQLDQRRGRADKARAAALEAERTEQSADARRRRLLAGHLSTVARRLAADLVSGEPCLVCGSTDHPDPARGADQEASEEPAREVGEEDVEQATEHLHDAARARARADSAFEAAREAVRELEEDLSELARQLREAGGADPDPADPAPATRVEVCAGEALVETAAAELEDAQRRHDMAEQSLRDQRRREADLARLREELAAARRGRLAGGHALERAEAEVDRLTHEITTSDVLLTRLRGSHPDVGARLTALELLETRCREAETVLNRWRDAEGSARAARESARQHLQDSPVAAEEELDSALLDDAAVHDHQKMIQAWNREEQRLGLAEESQDIVAAHALREEEPTLPEEVTVRAAEQHAEAADARHHQAQSARDRFEDRRRAAGEACLRMTAALRARDGELAEHRRLAELASTLNGAGPDNPRRMTLTSYVLAGRLERVASAATRHLQTMSEGRYQLLHDDAEGTGRRHGLELKVHDEHSDHERPTSSLSGGETFMASLAMALGLAEVVQSEAGGVGLESLFIDEGFGSLDEESLDHVMAALHRLQGEGRRVGVVSHVTEMHRAIPTQLQVIRRRTGSTVSMLIPGAIDSPQHSAEDTLSVP